MRFEVLTEMIMSINVFWDVLLGRLVERYRYFRGFCAVYIFMVVYGDSRFF
jgi:hypothetical protein